MNPPRVVIFSDNTGWHEERLLQAFSRRGVESRVVSLQDCRLETGAGGCGLRIGTLDNAVPDAECARIHLRTQGRAERAFHLCELVTALPLPLRVQDFWQIRRTMSASREEPPNS